MPRKKFGNASLDKPMKVKSQLPFSLLNQKEIDEKNKKIRIDNALKCSKEAAEKLMALLTHYKIDKENSERWFNLSFALAMEFVPGFKVVTDNRKTKPNKWTLLRYATLYFSVELEKKLRPNQTYSWICNHLTKEGNLWEGEKNLHPRYCESKESGLVRLLINAGTKIDKKICDELINLMKDKEMKKSYGI